MLDSERYRLLGQIGAGGLGVVHRVEDRASGQILAMKVMPRSLGIANLRSEFVALARLRHDNIVRVFDYGLTSSGQDFFTMELVEGPPLLEAVPEVPSPRFYQVVGGVLRALAFLHAREMVHADIKPSNILLDGALLPTDPGRAVRLVDFGLAATLADAREASATPPVGPVGTFNGFQFDAPMTERIDYVFVSPQFKVLSYAVLTDSTDRRYPSDHHPVVVRLRLD